MKSNQGFIQGGSALHSGAASSSEMIPTTSTTVIPVTQIRRVEVDGVNVFYREAGRVDAPVALLLHGFPASSFQYRELIPRLADRYRVIAPDLPGFGSRRFRLNDSTPTRLKALQRQSWLSPRRFT